MGNFTRLAAPTTAFDKMLRHFGVVTVMNVDVFDYKKENFKGKTIQQIYAQLYINGKLNTTKTSEKEDTNIIANHVHLDTLKVSNISIEGPSKTITGGQYNNSLLKYGKTARLEMQDALGNADALEVLGGAFIENTGAKLKDIGADVSAVTTAEDVLHIGSDFCGPKTIIGDSFFIDTTNGQQIKVKIIFYQFLPDSIFNLTQEADGDAAVFDLNGDLLMTDINVGYEGGTGTMSHGVFYSIIPEDGWTAEGEKPTGK